MIRFTNLESCYLPFGKEEITKFSFVISSLHYQEWGDDGKLTESWELGGGNDTEAHRKLGGGNDGS